jgi:ASC-1-like (ASCH) protein/ribosomal protein S18 acetylase RimI-like enzyme
MDPMPSAVQGVPESSELTVRPATADDMPYVVIAFERALSPYYGGDHTAHAHRVIQTHLSGGTDPRGLLSTRQLLLVLWEGSHRRGLLNLVFKRQATCKISPLILFPEGQQHKGLGNTLIQTAEHEAAKVGARQLYCTVAQSNRAALQFFRSIGFILCGEAHEQYKEGETEMLLRRPIPPEPGETAADDIISVTQIHNSVAWKEVKELLLEDLPRQVASGDDEWLESLRSNSEDEQPSADEGHGKVWVYAARDRSGRYRGAAIATSKKGGSIKIMPIAASDTPGFRALILDLPLLLAGKAHKAYIHYAPTTDQVAALQESSWQFESQFPGWYHPDVVTQQWGCSLGKAAPPPNLRIQDQFLNMITSGKKSLEVRVGYAHIKAIRPGTRIQFVANAGQTLCSVADVRKYGSLESMAKHEDVERALPGLAEDEALAQLRRIYPAEKERLGIVVLELAQDDT